MDEIYAFKCGECGELFEPTGKGNYDLQMHCRDMHQSTPKMLNCCIVNTRTGDVVHYGTGPQVIRMLQRQGILPGGPEPEPPDEEEPYEPRPAAEKPEKPKREAPLSRKEKAALAMQEQTGRTVMRDIVIPRQVEFVFYEAQGIWPDLYPDDSKESLGRFVRDFVVAAAIYMDMNAGQRMAKEMAEAFVASLHEYEAEEEGA